MLNIMLVDDHSLIRTGLRLLLQDNPSYHVACEAGSAEEALSLLRQNPVDLMILDISMPGMGGLECITEARRICPRIRIIMLSMHESDSYIRKAMTLGANGYIPKSSADDELLDAVRTVSEGKLYLSRNAEQSMLSMLFQRDEKQAAPLEQLSPREYEVFQYLIHGYTITEIGKKLHLSVKTIDTHKTKMMEKLGCTKRSDLVAFALEHHVFSQEWHD